MFMETQTQENSELPQEILLKIFTLCKKENGLISLCNLSQVCQSWRRIAFDHSLWDEVDDVHLTPSLLLELADAGAFSKTKSFNLRNTNSPHDDKYISSVLQHCPKLKCVHLSNKVCIPDYLKDLAMFCPEIEKMVFCQPFCFSVTELDQLLRRCGQKLIQFSLLDVDLDSAAFATLIIARHCPNLKELCLTCSSREERIPIKALERGCPKLSKLKLTVNGFTDVDFCESTPDGFSDLEEFDFSSFKTYSLDDSEIVYVLKAATNLKVLSLFDCNVSYETLLNLPPRNLKALKLSYCSIDPPSGLFVVLNKWKHSLTTLSISGLYVDDGDLVDHVRSFIEAGGKSVLKVLKLGSEFSSAKILLLVKSCPKLRYLKLLDMRLCSPKEIDRWTSFCSTIGK